MDGREMADRQRVALQNPCARAQDTGDERFFRFVRRGRMTFSTVLSVNK